MLYLSIYGSEKTKRRRLVVNKAKDGRRYVKCLA